MGLNKHFNIDIDDVKPEYTEYSFSFKLFPNLSIEGKREYKDNEYVLVGLEWLFWPITYYKKIKI